MRGKLVKALPVERLLQGVLGQIGQHRLANPGAIGRPHLARLAKHFNRLGCVALIDIQHLALIQLRKVDGFAQRGRKPVEMRARQRGKAGLRPGGMGQPHQPHTQGIGLIIGVIRQHVLMRQRLQKPVQRCLGVRRSSKQIGKAHRRAGISHHIQNIQRLANCSVTACWAVGNRFGHMASFHRVIGRCAVTPLLTG